MCVYIYKICINVCIYIFGQEIIFWNRNWKCNKSATLGTSGDSHGSRVYFSMTEIVFLVQFHVLTNLTLMGIEADVSTCVSLPKPHGLSWGD